MTATSEWPDRRVFEWAGYQTLSSNRLTVRQTLAYASKAQVFSFVFRDTDHGVNGTVILPKDDAVKLAHEILAAVGEKA